MDILLSLFSGAVGAGIFAIILRALDHYFNRGKTKADIGVAKSEESENIAEAAQAAANVLLQALNFKQSETKELQEAVEELKVSQKKNDDLIDDLTKRKEERDTQISELHERNEALQSKLAAMGKQIEKDTNETEALRKRITELEDRYDRMKRINEKLVKALQDAGLPMPDINGDLTDSVRGWKWNK